MATDLITSRISAGLVGSVLFAGCTVLRIASQRTPADAPRVKQGKDLVAKPFHSAILALLLLAPLQLSGQNWSTFLEPSRAINWSNAGFTIPNYTVNCATQPSLLTGSGNDAHNTAQIQSALNSCDATHNVVNLPAGTYYVAGIQFGTQGFQVLRGAGANQTHIIATGESNYGFATLQAPDWTYNGDPSIQPGGSRACNWTAGYSQGTTSITLNACGTDPHSWIGKFVILDQANDYTASAPVGGISPADTGGVFMCDGSTPDCAYETSANAEGRTVGGILYSEEQLVQITAVSGTGPYTVTISPGIYATNVRSGQNPGLWYPGFVQNDGIENMSIDLTSAGGGNDGITFFSCYQCWAKGVALLNGDRNALLFYQSSHDVVRDSYFYGALSHASTSYNIEADESCDGLIENNIMQQVTTTFNMNGSTCGFVMDYNFSVGNVFGGGGVYAWGLYPNHATANNYNLVEGNIANNSHSDNASGPADFVTHYRNLLPGLQPGTSATTEPMMIMAISRNYNVIGNVMGTLGYHTAYQAIATSPTTFSGSENTSIYFLGNGSGGSCSLVPSTSTNCDPRTVSTLMRWGNYDTVNAATQWSSTEAAPAANTYVSANFTTSYFNTLAHTLPASLIYNSAPSWWPSGKAWPPIGPDVSTGNVGTCSGGTYAGWMATSSGQCAGGTLSTAWASHATSIPAMDCYLTTMSGPLDGSGSALSFNASSCYSAVTPGPPSSLSGVIIKGGTLN